ncbi:7656_t:CDS:2 [Ambispora leptoticha]|uniref:7656_t:CDS:1 n=1 Tax=Ambispora leptoticha TaxID=144679 RepID=A0A9N8VAT9_9GLOM|nr:7656_t:CDS:2 [Ambispora leptoticha]
MSSHSQIKSHNIHLSTEIQKIINPREVISQSNIGGDNTQSINHITHFVETPIVTSDIQIKRKKLRSKTNQISDSSNIIARESHTVDSKVNTTKIIIKKDDLYTLIKQDHKETEEYERESERILATK